MSGFMRADIPIRSGDRPEVAGIAPHRQMTQRVPEGTAMHKRLIDAIAKMATEQPEEFYIETSVFEKHCKALFARQIQNPKCNGEICHVHPIDGSMHVTLHFADMKSVLENLWGGM
jgi:hypothetical protein